MSATIRLGGPRATRRESQDLRRGELQVQSPFGLDTAPALLVEALPRDPRPAAAGAPVRALFGMDTEGAPALAAAHLWPGAEIRWFHLDAYVAAKVAQVFADNTGDGGVLAAPIACGAVADLPAPPAAAPWDVIALPFPSAGESLLMRDLLEAAHDALRPGGRLVAATDRGGRALSESIAAVFGRVTPGPPSKRGATFFAERKKERPQLRDRSHVLSPEVAPATGGPPVRFEIETRPGTFSHGSVDRGTRALLEWFAPAGETSILDLGAGCGAIGVYAALANTSARVGLVESNVRAADCARRNLDRNGIAARAEVIVRADFEDLPAPSAGSAGWDLVLANPPYFGEFRIARSFAEAARRALRPGGRAAFVAKRGGASTGLTEVVREVFGRCTPADAGEYVIVAATN